MVEDESKCMWPIIYVRGYAMTQGEIDETTADPFCGFNLGSTVYRATSNRKAPPKKLIFESQVVRLEKNDMANFNRKRMAEYLNLGKLYKDGDEDARVDWLPEATCGSISGWMLPKSGFRRMSKPRSTKTGKSRPCTSSKCSLHLAASAGT